MTPEKRCKTCEWYDGIVCHRYPPSSFPYNIDGVRTHKFVATTVAHPDPDDWCAEWAPKEKP